MEETPGTIRLWPSTRQAEEIAARYQLESSRATGHYSAAKLPNDIRPVYLNCEDFKKHSFPNVLIEILDALFAELERRLTGWFGRKKRSRELLRQIRDELQTLRSKADEQDTEIREAEEKQVKDTQNAQLSLGYGGLGLKAGQNLEELSKLETERKYSLNQNKIRELDMWLPRLKQRIREFFDLSTTVRAVYLQNDDFYSLRDRVSSVWCWPGAAYLVTVCLFSSKY